MQLELAIILIACGMFLLIVFFHFKGHNSRINAIINAMGISTKKFQLSSRIKVPLQDEIIIVDYRSLPLGKYTEDASIEDEYVMVRVFFPTKVLILIKRRNSINLIDKVKIKYRKEVKSNNEEFDNKFVVRSNCEMGAFMLLQHKKIREAVKKVFNEFVHEINFDGQYICVKILTLLDGDLLPLRDLPEAIIALKKLLKEQGIMTDKKE